MNSNENGGMNVLAFSTLNNTFKINWIKQFLKNLQFRPLFPIICFLSLEASNVALQL